MDQAIAKHLFDGSHFQMKPMADAQKETSGIRGAGRRRSPTETWILKLLILHPFFFGSWATSSFVLDRDALVQRLQLINRCTRSTA